VSCCVCVEASHSNVIPVYTKLLNINAHAQTALPSYDGLLLSTQFVTDSYPQVFVALCLALMSILLFKSVREAKPRGVCGILLL
jgi:hypothetical protein